MQRYLGQFDASDPDGARYTLYAWDDDGTVRVETTDGKPVARVERGRYRLVRHSLAVELTSDESNAP